MRFYNQPHQFYCRIDHASIMHLCILDQGGHVVLDKNLPRDADRFLRAVVPFRDDLVVAAECMFG